MDTIMIITSDTIKEKYTMGGNINVNKLETVEKRKQIKDLDYNDRRISYFIISYYFILILNLAIKTIFPIPKSLYPKISVLFGLILVVFFITTISMVLKRSLTIFIFSEFLFISLFAISYLMGNVESSLLLENAVWAICICVP